MPDIDTQRALFERRSVILGSLVLAMSLTMTSCRDPVTGDAIAALGPEDPSVPRGPFHRPGQPCLLCHQDFSLAGTVYSEVTSAAPVGGASVYIIDSTDNQFVATTNCAGNFYVRAGSFDPQYPIWMSVVDGNVERDMSSPSYRWGACASCHTRPVGPGSPGPVYLIQDPTTETLPSSQCP
jgi:hypothetical protein